MLGTKKKTSNARAFFMWCLLALVVWLLYRPFLQPILGDRAYLIYMAQEISRGQPIYHTTTFGYTPVGPLVLGGFFKLIQSLIPAASTLVLARLLGLLGYMALAGSMFLLGRRLFAHRWQAHLGVAFTLGFSFLTIFFTTSLEPKGLATLLAVWALYAALGQRWWWAGVWSALAVMTWQPMAVVGLALGLVVLFQGKKAWAGLLPMALGATLGLLPTVVYLWASDSFDPFWAQAIVRKANVEGKAIFERPFRWLMAGVVPHFITDLPIFIAALLGLVGLGWSWKTHHDRVAGWFGHPIALPLLLTTTACWSVLNAMEFQSGPDLLPMLPLLALWAVIGIGFVRPLLSSKQARLALWVVVLVLAYADTVGYRPLYTFAEHETLVERLHREYPRAFVINFESYYVLKEQRMPTKFMRYAPYEDYLINQEPEGCDGVLRQLQDSPPGGIIFRFTFNLEGYDEGCAFRVIEAFADGQAYEEFDLPFEKMHHPLLPNRPSTVRLYPVHPK